MCSLEICTGLFGEVYTVCVSLFRSRSRSRSPRAKPAAPRRQRSPTPKPTKIYIGHLTRNVNREHIIEIFSIYGTVKSVEMPADRNHPEFSSGHAYIDFELSDDAEKAVLRMNGGWSYFCFREKWNL